MANKEYTIVGDVDGLGECLALVTCEECAEKSLAKALKDPRLAERGYKNLRIKIEEGPGWWRDPFLVN